MQHSVQHTTSKFRKPAICFFVLVQGITWEKAKQYVVQSRHNSLGKAIVKTTTITAAFVVQEHLKTTWTTHTNTGTLRSQAVGSPSSSWLLSPISASLLSELL